MKASSSSRVSFYTSDAIEIEQALMPRALTQQRVRKPPCSSIHASAATINNTRDTALALSRSFTLAALVHKSPPLSQRSVRSVSPYSCVTRSDVLNHCDAGPIVWFWRISIDSFQSLESEYRYSNLHKSHVSWQSYTGQDSLQAASTRQPDGARSLPDLD